MRGDVGASAGVGGGSNYKYVVAGDIGGTNARFQLWRIFDDGTRDKELAYRKKYPTRDYATFVDALLQFEVDCIAELSEAEYAKPEAAAFAAAGVVDKHSYCQMTNLNWTLDATEIEKRTGWHRVNVLNDFEAVGYGVLATPPEDMHPIHEGGLPDDLEHGGIASRGPKVVLGPGTGFGQAQLFWNDAVSDYTVMPSEGAHGDFAPRGAKQRRLAGFVEGMHGYCEIEHVCCGPGLENIYNFLREDEGRESADMPAPEIADAALAGTCPLAREAVEMLMHILGQEAGNWALRSLAQGGVFIAGGITPKLLPIVKNGGLKNASLHEASRFSKVIRKIPLNLITTDDVGLSGSVFYATRMLTL